MDRPAITPMPPVADIAMPWDVDVDDPVEEIGRARARHGDTFVVDSSGDRYLFLFSPGGISAFYGLVEEDASKGIADWRMLRRKVPPELFEGRRVLPHDLFGRTEIDVQARSLEAAIPRMLDRLAPGDIVDVFEWSRSLGHRIGLTSWGGLEMLDAGELDALVDALDGLDASEAFVRPDRMAAIAQSAYHEERAALGRAVDIIGDLVHRRIREGRSGHDLLDVMITSWEDVPLAERVVGVAHDVVLVHLASMSNLFAAIGWTIVDVVSRPALADRIRRGDDALLVRCALESIRCAQRSVMLRHVLRPVEIGTTEDQRLVVDAGVTVATLLPLTNRSAASGLVNYDPDRWADQRSGVDGALAARELVTTFGHGPHRCPARSFSLRAISSTVQRLLQVFDVTMVDDSPRPLSSQIGGVSRIERPCRIRLSGRT